MPPDASDFTHHMRLHACIHSSMHASGVIAAHRSPSTPSLQADLAMHVAPAVDGDKAAQERDEDADHKCLLVQAALL